MPLLTPTHHRIASWITQRLHRRTAHLSPTTRALLWAASAGLIFNLLNAVMRGLSQHVHPFQAQFLRYVFGLVILLPFVVRHGMAAYRPKSLGGQFTRGALHTVGLFFWFAALPKIALADMTAIGFTTPLFVMLGAYLFLHEPMRWERWVATALGFGGVLIVVGPQFAMQGTGSGWYHLVMLASAPCLRPRFW